MSLEVLWVVLAAALIHAVWNAAVQHGVRREVPYAAVFVGAGAISLVASAWVPFPIAAAWPYIIASALTHLVYCVALGRAYRTGDFSHTYPLMRGLPPLFTAGAVALLGGERISLAQQAAMLVLCAGIVCLAFEGRFREGTLKASLRWGLIVAATIAVYTTIDGIGVRASGHALSYIVWLMVLEGLTLGAYVSITEGRKTWRAILRNWPFTLGGGFLSAAGYGLVLWAMMRAPIALVAAARETSVVFAVLIGVIAFKEKLSTVRIASIALVMVGLVAIRLA